MTFKRLVFAAVVTTTSLSAVAAKNFLWDTNFCRTAAIRCSADSVFAHDQDGRCGCLKAGDYLDPETCRTAFIMCDELRGETYATLTSNDEFIGCGCYKTN